MEQRTDSEAVKLYAKADTRNKKKKRYPFDFVVVQVQIWLSAVLYHLWSACMLLVRHLYVRVCSCSAQLTINLTNCKYDCGKCIYF